MTFQDRREAAVTAPTGNTAATSLHGGPVVDEVGGFDVIDCAACGFRHVVPLPSEDELVAVYRHEYYDTEKPLYLERHAQDEAWLAIDYEARYRTFERELGFGDDVRGRILDVGSGPGFFLAHGKSRGWGGLGIEPSRQAAEHARGLGVEVIEEFLSPELAARLGTFDAVHLNEVLEHVPDPRRLLETCRSLLAPGGVLCVSVPNDYNPLQEALRESRGFQPWWVAPPHHLNFFDFRSLARLVESLELEVVQEDTSFPMELFLLMGDNFVGDEAKGRRCHERRMNFERALVDSGRASLLRDVYVRLAELGLGRHAILYARHR